MIEYDGFQRRTIPILEPKEGYVIEFDDESGWPYYLSVEAFEHKKRMYEHFVSLVNSRIKGEPVKGMIQISSTAADVKGDDDFKKLWQEFNTP